MKKKVLAFAALAAVSGVAMAQSSVTAFGIVDLAARSLKGDDTLKLLNNEGRAASRLGFRGVEDLGGGMKASFWIEHGLNADDGSFGGNFWQRRATVSLSGGFGEVRLGRHKYSNRLVLDDFDPFSTSGMADVSRVFTSLGLIAAPSARNFSGTFINRGNNQIGYHLPAMGGVYGSVDLNAGEGVNADKAITGRLGYKSGPMHFAVGYGQHGATGKLKNMIIGGSYDIGGVLLMGSYTENKRGSAKQKVATLAAVATMGSHKFTGSYAKAGGLATAKADLLAVGYDYSLSKRTSVYGTLARTNNKEATRFTLNGAKEAALLSANGRDSSGYEFGIRHNF